MDKFVSIIVPVYNVGKYIDECVNSLVQQSYENIDVILINDGSKDNSGERCDAWAEKDSRVRVIHKANGGAASARNAGLDTATGKWICFVDGDDTVEVDYVKSLVDTAVSADSDASVCGFSYLYRNGKKQCPAVENEIVLDRDGYMLRFLNDWTASLLWNKIFSRESIGEIRMDEGHKVDDEFFTYRVCMNCKRVSIIPDCMYNYRIRSSSVMQDTSPEKAERYMLDRIAYNTDRLNNISIKMPHIAEQYFGSTIETIARYWNHSKEMPIAQKQIRAWINDNIFRLIFSKLGVKQKLSYIKRFYFLKPTFVGEKITIDVPSTECFD